MEKVEIIDTVEEVMEEHDGNIGDAIVDVADDKMELFIEGYNEGLGKGLVLGSGFVAGAWAGTSLWKNREVIQSKVKGMFKRGKKDVTEVKRSTERPVKR